jgi:hypothetical protein
MLAVGALASVLALLRVPRLLMPVVVTVHVPVLVTVCVVPLRWYHFFYFSGTKYVNALESVRDSRTKTHLSATFPSFSEYLAA